MTSADAPVLVYLSPAFWKGMWGTWQHVASRLDGWRVLFVEPAVSVASPLRDPARLRQIVRRRERVRDDFVVMSPFALPPQTLPLLRNRNADMIERQIRTALDGLGWPDPSVVVTDHAYHWRFKQRFAPATFCFHVTGEPYWHEPDFLGEYYHTLEEADCVLTLSPPLATRAETYGKPTLLIDEGVDVDAIRTSQAQPEPDDLAGIPHPRVVYVGSVAYRVDLDLITACAQARPDVHFVYIGGGTTTSASATDAPDEYAALGRLANVHMLGPKPQADLGAYLGRCDVGWVPYLWTPYNRTCNPLKVMEYLAVGLPVVANAFDGLRHLDDLIHLVDEGDDFTTPLDAALAEVDDADARTRRVAYAEANTWAKNARTASDWLHAQSGN